MALRYSGNARIRLLWDDSLAAYRVRISVGGRNVWSGVIGAPAALGHAVDSSEAYSATARAALSFAMDEGVDLSPDVNGEDWIVRTQP